MPLPRWALGGGTALMIHDWHRSSKDIDLFIDDPQYLGVLSPRLTDHFGVGHGDYHEAAHYLKVKYPDGEIDFIVSDPLSQNPQTQFEFQGRPIPIETPVEIALKKLHHRAQGLTPRDIFDVGVVLHRHHDPLFRELDVLSPVKHVLEQRLDAIPEPYLQAALSDLEIYPQWAWLKARARSLVQDLVRAIPNRAMAKTRGQGVGVGQPWPVASPAAAAQSYLAAMATTKALLRVAKNSGDHSAYLELAVQRRDLAVQALSLGLIPAIRALDPAAASHAERLGGRTDAEVRDRANRAVPDQDRELDGPDM